MPTRVAPAVEMYEAFCVEVAHLLAATAFADSVPPVNESPDPIVVLVTFPLASVRRSAFGTVERMSAEVEAVFAER